MEVDTLMLADGAQAVGGKVYILGGGWNTVWARTFPAEHKLSVAVGLRIGWNETHFRHKFALEVQTLARSAVQQLAAGEFEAGKPAGMKEGADQSFMIAIEGMLKLETEAELQLAVIMNGEQLKAIPFRIVKVAIPPLG